MLRASAYSGQACFVRQISPLRNAPHCFGRNDKSGCASVEMTICSVRMTKRRRAGRLGPGFVNPRKLTLGISATLRESWRCTGHHWAIIYSSFPFLISLPNLSFPIFPPVCESGVRSLHLKYYLICDPIIPFFHKIYIAASIHFPSKVFNLVIL